VGYVRPAPGVATEGPLSYSPIPCVNSASRQVR
jgi:hypothetical protein